MFVMNKTLRYSQFIYGKLAGSKDSGYSLVARTADLTNQEQLVTMVEKTYRFWKEQPPVRDNIKAAGMFPQDNNLVLIQASTAVDENGQLAISGSRDFNQHRYVFIPLDSLAVLQGRTFRLLYWILNQSIPIQYEFNTNLASLQIPLLEEQISAELREQEVTKIQRYLSDRDTKIPWLLEAQDALINSQRLLLTLDDTIQPENFLEIILLLLPAVCRSQVSVAVGTLDEQQCNWAQVIIKFNNSLQSRLPNDLIWLNRAIRKNEVWFNQKQFKSPYLNFIQSIINIPGKVPQLLEQLESINNNNITLRNLTAPQAIIRLIPLLLEEEQDAARHTYLSELSTEEWQTIIPIITDHDQQTLKFAWQKLGISTIQQPEQYTPLMLEVWKRLLVVEKIRQLQQLQHSLKLAEILLQYGLLEPAYIENSDPAVMRELIILSKNVVAFKAQHGWRLAWQLATHFATKPIFQDKTECFCLLDTALISEIPIQNLYEFFNSKFVNLLPHTESIKIQQSNLYRQLLTQEAEAAKLLDILLIKQNGALNILPQLSKMTGMTNLQQDNFYYQILTNWSPSYEEASNLLVPLIQLENFDLNQTFSWFENKKPGVIEVLSNLKHSSTCWDCWEKLASILYTTLQESVDFLDSLVGTKLPIDTVQKWLPIIATDEKMRKKFCINSCAWKALQHQDLNKLVVKLPQYAVTLTRCLQNSERFDWIKGDLLHCLCENWISQRSIDSQLQTLVTSPIVTQRFSNQDWLQIQMVGWKLGIELELPPSRPFLQDDEKKFLSDYALKVLDNQTQFQQRQSLLYDCRAWSLGSTELKNIAIRVVDLYTQPEQTQHLLDNCATWGLSISQQKEILKAAPIAALNIDLILKYLGRDGKAFNIDQELDLLEILLQIQPCHDAEIANLRVFSIKNLNHLVSQNNIEMIKWWQEKACHRQVYLEAFNLAVQDFGRQIKFEKLKYYSQKLKEYSLFEEQFLIFKAHYYWLSEEIMKLVWQEFKNLK
jgi:hypothetical protein